MLARGRRQPPKKEAPKEIKPNLDEQTDKRIDNIMEMPKIKKQRAKASKHDIENFDF